MPWQVIPKCHWLNGSSSHNRTLWLATESWQFEVQWMCAKAKMAHLFWVCACHRVCTEVKGTLGETIISYNLRETIGSYRLSSGHQTWQQMTLPTQPISTYLHLIVWDNEYLVPEVANMARLGGQRDPGILLLGLQLRGYRSCGHARPFTQGLGTKLRSSHLCSKRFTEPPPTPCCSPCGFQEGVLWLGNRSFSAAHAVVLESCMSHVSWVMEVIVKLLCAEIIRIHLFYACHVCLILNKN